MLKEVILKSHDSAVDRRYLLNVRLFIPDKGSTFVETVKLLTINGDNTDLRAV